MSCGHDGCTCGPDTAVNNELPQAVPASGPSGGCCGGHSHGHSEPER